MLRRTKWVRGQVTVEVAIMFAFLVAAFIALALYFQRGVQGYLKSNSDSWGTQFSSGEKWTSHSRSHTIDTKAATKTAQESKACQGVNKDNPGCDPGAVYPDPLGVAMPQ